MEKKSMGSFLNALRKASGLTQKQLAEKLNVSDKAVSRWERDECAPDLSLIPVLAEIYGVTSDEILRGQRTDPEKLYQGSDRIKAEKQRNRILRSAKTKFICRSLITVAVTLMGSILSYILNAEFAKANAGFLLGSIFFIGATVCQTLFLVTGFASVSDEDWQSSGIESCKGFMLLTSEWCLGIIGAAIALCIPFAGKDSVAFADWVFEGIQWLFAVTVLITILSIVVNFCMKRKGAVDLKQPRNNLRLRCATVLALVLVLLLGVQSGMNQYLTTHRHLYAPHDTPVSLQSFRGLMEEPMSPEGEYMVEDQSGELITCYVPIPHMNGYERGTTYRFSEKEITKKLIPNNKEPGNGNKPFTEQFGYQFRHLNLYVPYYELSDAPELLPIYTFNIHQLAEANRIVLNYNLIYLLTYVLAVALTLAVYNSKEKKLS
jgi:transcriptional regulator with XRE-family HTH domain